MEQHAEPDPAAAIEAHNRIAAKYGQPWVQAWIRDPTPVEEVGRLATMIRRWPRGNRDLAIRFPPYSLVEAVPGRRYVIPFPGTLGIVYGMHPAGREGPAAVEIRPAPNMPATGIVPADHLVLRGWRQGLGPHWIREVVAGVEADQVSTYLDWEPIDRGFTVAEVAAGVNLPEDRTLRALQVAASRGLISMTRDGLWVSK